MDIRYDEKRNGLVGFYRHLGFKRRIEFIRAARSQPSIKLITTSLHFASHTIDLTDFDEDGNEIPEGMHTSEFIEGIAYVHGEDYLLGNRIRPFLNIEKCTEHQLRKEMKRATGILIEIQRLKTETALAEDNRVEVETIRPGTFEAVEFIRLLIGNDLFNKLKDQILGNQLSHLQIDLDTTFDPETTYERAPPVFTAQIDDWKGHSYPVLAMITKNDVSNSEELPEDFQLLESNEYDLAFLFRISGFFTVSNSTTISKMLFKPDRTPFRYVHFFVGEGFQPLLKTAFKLLRRIASSALAILLILIYLIWFR